MEKLELRLLGLDTELEPLGGPDMGSKICSDLPIFSLGCLMATKYVRKSSSLFHRAKVQ